METEIKKIKDLLEKEMTISQNLFLLSYISIENMKIGSFLQSQGIGRIAVYGLGKVGQLFVQILKKEKYDIAYVIDKNANAHTNKYRVIHSLEEIESDFDAIIVTSDFYYEEIRRDIDDHMNVRIILLHDLLDYIALTPIPVE